MAPARLLASTLCLLLISSCSTTRHTAAPDIEELTQHVLVIEGSPDGQVTHRWQRAEDFDLSRYRYPSSTQGPSGHIVLVSGHQRDCHAEFNACVAMCMNRPLPRGFGHITVGGRGKGGKEKWCRDQCWQAYLDCEELQGRRPQEFSAVDEATDWLKRNPQALLVGSIVVIAGVAFVAVSASAGLVVLAPAVLLAS